MVASISSATSTSSLSLYAWLAKIKNEKAEAAAKELATKIEEGVKSGNINAKQLQATLTTDLGDSASGIVSEDGTVSVDKLEKLLEAAQADRSMGPMGADPGKKPSAEEMVQRIKQDIESGNLSATDLQSKLTADFGDAASGIVGADGTVDYEKLQTLFETATPTQGPGKMPSAEEMVQQIKQDIESGNLSATDLQNQLTTDFGDAASGIVGADGTIDYTKLQELLEANRPAMPPQGGGAPGGLMSKGV